MKTKQKLSRREVLTEFRKGEILNAAMDLVNAEGMEHLTMERLAGRAGIAKGTIYLYFKDKEQLIGTLLQQILKLMLERLRVAIEKDGALRKRLFWVIEELNEFLLKYDKFFRYVHHPSGMHKNVSGKYGVERYVDEMVAITSQLFKDAMKRGEIRKANPVLISRLFLNSIYVVLVRDIYTPGSDVNADAGMLIDLYLNGLIRIRDGKNV